MKYICNKGRARFVEAVPDDAPLWQRLHMVADRNLALFARAYEDYRKALQARLPLEDLERALDSRDPLTIQAVIGRLKTVSVGKAQQFPDDPLEGLTARYRDVILAGAKEALSLEPEVLRDLPFLRTGLKVTNAHAIRAATRHAARMVTEVDRQTQRAVASIIATALDVRTSMAPRQSAVLIREVVGLHSRQAGALARYSQGLTGTPESIDRRIAAYAGRLHRSRAMTIARTETIRASNAGVKVLGDEIKDLPFMRTTDIEYVWITTPDDKLCDDCEAMDGVVVGHGATFSAEDTNLTAESPPLHPNCRCAIAREVADIEELEERMRDFGAIPSDES